MYGSVTWNEGVCDIFTWYRRHTPEGQVNITAYFSFVTGFLMQSVIKKETNFQLILQRCLFPRASNCLGLNSKIRKLVISRGVVKRQFYQKERSGSEEEVFLMLSQSNIWRYFWTIHPQIFMSVVQQDTLKPGCLQVDVGDVESNLLKTRNLAGVTQSSLLKYISC